MLHYALSPSREPNLHEVGQGNRAPSVLLEGDRFVLVTLVTVVVVEVTSNTREAQKERGGRFGRFGAEKDLAGIDGQAFDGARQGVRGSASS